MPRFRAAFDLVAAFLADGLRQHPDVADRRDARRRQRRKLRAGGKRRLPA